MRINEHNNIIEHTNKYVRILSSYYKYILQILSGVFYKSCHMNDNYNLEWSVPGRIWFSDN